MICFFLYYSVLGVEHKMRVDKFLSECTSFSRKEIKKLIKSGVIFVNGEAVLKSEMQIDENTDEVSVNGEAIEYKKYIYLMMNKPSGVVSATWDKNQPYVTELVPDEFSHYGVFPVGRLDIDTEGLLILTNDGDLNHKLTSPKKNVYKRYFAVLEKEAEEKDIEIFEKGIELSDFTTKPAKLEICENKKEVYVSISEGKFHQVKRMCAYIGKNVVFLKRVSMGALKLDENLKAGECRKLTDEEVKMLFTNE